MRHRLLVLLLVPVAGLLLTPRPRAALVPLACGAAGPLPTECGNIVFDGDSISAGYGSSPGSGPDALFLRALDRPARIADVAVAGRPVSDCLKLFDQTVRSRYAAGAQFNLIVFHAGDNDIAQGRDAQATYRAFAAYVVRAHEQGWKVLVSTELPSPHFKPEREAQLEDYNRRLVENRAGADVVVDLGRLARLNDSAGRAQSGLYSADEIHPNDAGYAELNRLLVEAARTVLPR